MALRSMTGFGSAARTWPDGPDGPVGVEVEVRSVNARGLDLKLRQPFGLAVELELRRLVEGAIGRGRVELRVALRPGAPATADPLRAIGVDENRVALAVRAVAEVERRARAGGLTLAPTSAAALLRVAAGPRNDGDAAPAPAFLAELVETALAALVGMRAREGEALGREVAGQLDQLDARLAALRRDAEGQPELLRTRLQQRAAELCAASGVAAPDPQRLAQEVALLVARADVSEELARVASHLRQAREVAEGTARPGQGRTLDFLAQELLREITTIGGKIVRGGSMVIEAKGIVGQLREQVQNVE